MATVNEQSSISQNYDFTLGIVKLIDNFSMARQARWCEVDFFLLLRDG